MTHSRLQQRATGWSSTRAAAPRHVGIAGPGGPGARVGEGRARGRPPVCGRRVGADPFHAAVPGRAVDAQASRAVRTPKFGVKGAPAADRLSAAAVSVPIPSTLRWRAGKYTLESNAQAERQVRDEGRARGRPPICGRRVGADPFHAAVVSKALDTRVRGAGRTTSSGKGRARGRPPVCGRRVGADPFHAAVADREVDIRVSCAGRTTKFGVKGEPAAGRLSADAVSVLIPARCSEREVPASWYRYSGAGSH